MNEKQQRQDVVLKMLKSFEGTKQYQEKLGYFRNSKFRIYKDSEGYETIGYGHLILPVERQHFIDGITELQADQLLLLDYQKAVNGVDSLKLGLRQDSRWYSMCVVLVFQLGLTGFSNFRRCIAALRNQNYATALAELRDSKLYRQTPNRIDYLINWVTKK